MIDWILAEKIAGLRRRHRRSPAADSRSAALADESETRVTAYTGLRPPDPLPTRKESAGASGWRTNISSMRMLLDPVLQRAGTGLGPLRPAVELGVGLRALRRGRGRRSATSAQRVLGQYELVLLDEAVEDRRHGCCSCCPTSARRCATLRRQRAASS